MRKDGEETTTTASMPTEFDDAVMWAAWLYYADQLTQSEIAKKLRVSRATIVNYLQEARERGIVSVSISPKAGSRTNVARALMERFGLEGAFVIPSGEDRDLAQRLGDAGARSGCRPDAAPATPGRGGRAGGPPGASRGGEAHGGEAGDGRCARRGLERLA